MTERATQLLQNPMFFVPEKGVVLGAFSRTIMETQIKLPLLSQPLFYSFSQKYEFPLLVAMPILHAVLSSIFVLFHG